MRRVAVVARGLAVLVAGLYVSPHGPAAFAQGEPIATGLARATTNSNASPLSAADGASSYTVTATLGSPAHFTVYAELPITDDTLHMVPTRPCDLAELCSAGWPSLVRDLRVADAAGHVLHPEAIGPRGWVVHDLRGGRVTLQYVVDYRLLADHHWPAPREAAYSDESGLLSVGRPLFIGTSAAHTTRVRFILPRGLVLSAPWQRDGGDAPVFTVDGLGPLANNAFVIGSLPPTSVTAGRFSLQIALFGQWHRQRELVRRVVHAHITTFTRLFGFDGQGNYLAAFLNDSEMAGESFPNSYVLSADPDAPVGQWGKAIGHEIFHYWNGHRIRGADDAGSQWFQEGITEYYAIMSMARNGLIAPAAALADLSEHLRADRQFGKSLVTSGNQKDRGFYGRATMVALVLDLMIRDRTSGRRSLDDMMRQMWLHFGRTDRLYTQADVVALASATADTDLGAFFRDHVEDDVPLPLDSALSLAGLTLARNAQHDEVIAPDSLAPRPRRNQWRALMSERPSGAMDDSSRGTEHPQSK